MAPYRVVITDSDLPGDTGAGALRAAGLEVTVAPDATPDAIIEAARDAAALIVQWAKISDDVLAQLPGLQIVSRLGIGYDMIDVPAATRHGVAVANTPAYCVDEVATHTVAMVLTLARGLAHYDHDVRQGVWRAASARPRALRPAVTTALVAGFGRIGSQVAGSLRALGFRVLVHDPFVPADVLVEQGFVPVDLESGLRQSDVVSLHVPLDGATRHMLNRETLALLPAGSLVVNTCRGGLIDETALLEALASGHVGGAGLDVFEHEPLRPDHPLLAHDNVLVTPHAAWYSPESLTDLPVQAAENVIRFLAGEPVGSIVNPDYAGHLRRSRV